MARTRLVNGVRIPFTPEQETARDVEEARPPRPPVDPVTTPTQPDDILRALMLPGVTLPLTQADIDTAKRGR